MESSIDIRSTYGISEEQMALMLLDSIKNAEDDVQQRGILEAINEANNILQASDKFIQQNEDILSDAEIEKLRNLTEKLEKAVHSGEKDTIHTAITKLNDYSLPLAQRSLDANISKALKGVKV